MANIKIFQLKKLILIVIEDMGHKVKLKIQVQITFLHKIQIITPMIAHKFPPAAISKIINNKNNLKKMKKFFKLPNFNKSKFFNLKKKIQ